MTISISKPTPGADQDDWGNVLNAALDVIVGGVNEALDEADTALTVAGAAFPAPTTPPVVTGFKSSNAALTSVIAALVSLGLITDATS